MSTTLELDHAGNLLIPAELLKGDSFANVMKVGVAESSGGLFISPRSEAVEGTLVRDSNGFLVIRGGGRITNAEVIQAIKTERNRR